MKRGTKLFKFNGLGFPVVIVDAPYHVTDAGDEVMDINYNFLSDGIFAAVIRKPARLSGAEVLFARRHMGMTQAEFARMLVVDRSAIAKWEAKDLKATEMAAPTEGWLRMCMARHMGMDLGAAMALIGDPLTKKSAGHTLRVVSIDAPLQPHPVEAARA